MMEPIDLCELYNPFAFTLSNDVEFDKKKLYHLKELQIQLLLNYSQEHLLLYGETSPRKSELKSNLRYRIKIQCSIGT